MGSKPKTSAYWHLFRLLRGVIITLTIIALWQLIVVIFAPRPFIFPSPKSVFFEIFNNFDFFFYHTRITALEILLGFVVGTSIGIITAIVMILSPLMQRLINPFLAISQALPVFAIAPLLVIWSGYGLASKIIMAALIIYFPVASSFFDGLVRCPRNFHNLATLYGATRMQRLWLIEIPAAIPSLASGMRIAATIAPIGAVVGEWVGASAGLGYIMLHANARMQTDSIFAALIFLGALAIAFRAGVIWILTKIRPEQSV